MRQVTINETVKFIHDGAVLEGVVMNIRKGSYYIAVPGYSHMFAVSPDRLVETEAMA